MGIWRDYTTTRGHQFWTKISGILRKVLWIDAADGGLVFRSGSTYSTKVKGDPAATGNLIITLPKTTGGFGSSTTPPSLQSVTAFSTELSNTTNTSLTINKLNNTLIQNTWNTSAAWNLSVAQYGKGGSGTQNAALTMGGFGPITNNDKFNGLAWAASTVLPSGRYTISAVGIQNATMISGGQGTGTTSTTFNGSTWTNIGTMNYGRSWHASAGIQNAALAFGGLSQYSTERFNGSTWSSLVLSISTRDYIAGCGTQNAAICFAGSTPFSAVTQRFNGLTWSLTGSLIIARDGPAAVGTQNAALCIGGENAGGNVNDTEKYNGNTWFATGTLNTARFFLSGAGTQNAALSFGGHTGVLSLVTEKFQGEVLFNILTSAKNDTTYENNSDLNISVPTNSRIVTDIAATSYIDVIDELSDLVELNRLQDSNYIWSATGSMNTPRRDLGGCGTQGTALSFGGDTGSASSITEKFNGSTWTYSSSMNIPREQIAGCGTQNAALSFGGNRVSFGILSTTERFNGLTWSLVCGLNTARRYLGGAGTQNSALSFGGDNGSISPVTEKFSNNFTFITSPIQILI